MILLESIDLKFLIVSSIFPLLLTKNCIISVGSCTIDLSSNIFLTPFFIFLSITVIFG